MVALRRALVFSLLLININSSVAQQSGAETERPLKIVLTNDDGVEDLNDRLIPLAQALVPFAEVYIVVAAHDRSGSTNYSSLGKSKRTLESELIYSREKEDARERIEIHVVDGFPADCVSLAIRGILRDSPPDLVISGINGGPNLGEGWIGSGTIGAARMAAFYGIPALAVSGIDDDLDGAVEAVTQWVAQLAQSPFVLDLESGQYLTVGLPRVEPSKIKGIRIASRAPSLSQGYFDPIGTTTGEDGKRTIWLAHPSQNQVRPPEGSDIAWYLEGYIVITPMKLDEHDEAMLENLKDDSTEIPKWGGR